MKAPVLASFIFFAVTLTHAAELTGRVVRVIDGDTLELLTEDRHPIRIRLSEIDAPEHGQPYGTRAKKALSMLAFDREANVTVTGHDRYRRTLGRVYVDGVDVNAELIRQGAAWVYVQYNHDHALVPIEAEARAAHRGLWSLPETDILPPWEWRKLRSK